MRFGADRACGAAIMSPRIGLVATALFILGAVHCGGETGETGPGGDTGEGDHMPADLSKCNVPLDCEFIYDHLNLGPSDALRCAGRLIASGKRGRIQADHNICCGSTFSRFIVLLGDGTALLQQTDSNCNDEFVCGDAVVGEQKLCKINDLARLQNDCDSSAEDDEDCKWNPLADLTDCVPASPEYTCESAASAAKN